jgi:anthranilate synthase component II
MLLVIDNYDSFTYNLVQYLRELGAEVRVERNDAITISEIAALAPDRLLLSPGPRTPTDAGICLDVIQHFAPSIPILGVCLGHQAIGQYYGARVGHARRVMHGKTSLVHHEEESVFRGLPTPVQVGRYHSLVIDASTLPDCLNVTAWTESPSGEQDEIMGISHKTYPLHGVQFHPESILSEYGHPLLANFLENP